MDSSYPAEHAGTAGALFASQMVLKRKIDEIKARVTSAGANVAAG
jgi:hypothetical protein